MKLGTRPFAAKFGWQARPRGAGPRPATRLASSLLLVIHMLERIGIGIANLFGRAVADALMDGVAALGAIRWASLSLFVDLGADDAGRNE